MKDTMNKIKNTKDKAVGETKIAVGKVTKNEELKVKGHIQATKGEIGLKTGEIKKDVSKKVDKIFDKK